jgi:polyribonucleotide nucleotidyltransferase
MEKKKFSLEIGGKTLTAEVSSLGEQANAAVLVQYGETIVLATAVMGKYDKPLDYMPLKVDYEERFYAAGKVLGSRFMRREGRPSEDAILAGRLIDRTIRPLFNNRVRREIQVVITVLQYDEEQSPDLVGLIGASLALGMSDIPWDGPVAATRISSLNGKLVLNPSNTERKEGESFMAFAAGPKDLISMIELEGNDANEDEIVKAFAMAQDEINKVIDFQNQIIKEIGKPKAAVKLAEVDPDLIAACAEFLSEEKMEHAVYPQLHPEDRVHELDKVEREIRIGNLKEALYAFLKEKFKDRLPAVHLGPVEFIFDETIDALVHKNILEKELRPDSRRVDEVRPLSGEVGLFSRTHGSAVFMRGNTQALAITTIAPPGQEQLIEGMETTEKRRFLLHYNFPPYSVGETGMFRGPGRREIGHGALASKAIEPQIPSSADFPYSIRVVNEILSSNGSSSMATVCATTMSLMDAGVPMKKPVAGIAMGLMSDTKGGAPVAANKYKVLTDLQGPEDHYGDMDFKVAGTRDGVNAIQLDVKIGGLTNKMIVETMAQARVARMHILDFIATVIPAPKAEISMYAPRVFRISINPEKIGMVIGPGGKMINGLIAKYGLAGIDIEEDGSVFISGMDAAKANQALADIQSLTKDYKVGDIIEGNIIKIMDFGAIVDLGGGMDGMIHVSELKDGFVKLVTDVVKLGDFVRAKVIKVEAGKIGLSIKQLAGQ